MNGVLLRWHFSTNHKEMEFILFIFGLISMLFGLIVSMLIRIELTQLDTQTLVINYQLFYVLIIGRVLLKLFFIFLPIIGEICQFFVPKLIVGSDTTYPKIDSGTFWLLYPGLLLLLLHGVFC